MAIVPLILACGKEKRKGPPGEPGGGKEENSRKRWIVLTDCLAANCFWTFQPFCCFDPPLQSSPTKTTLPRLELQAAELVQTRGRKVVIMENTRIGLCLAPFDGE